jgi:hypothetical protein
LIGAFPVGQVATQVPEYVYMLAAQVVQVVLDPAQVAQLVAHEAHWVPSA